MLRAPLATLGRIAAATPRPSATTAVGESAAPAVSSDASPHASAALESAAPTDNPDPTAAEPAPSVAPRTLAPTEGPVAPGAGSDAPGASFMPLLLLALLAAIGTVLLGFAAGRRAASGVGGIRMRRVLRFTLALALALGWQLTPPAAQPVAAACTTPSCATLEIVFGHGAGTGLATTFPFGMDCEWTGTARAGTCVVQYDVGSGIDVTLYLDPGPHSYVCYGNTCAGLETRLERTIHLNPGDNIDVFPVFNLGVRATVEMSVGGTGDGRVTSVPAGLNCRWLDGAKSGTCRADFYFYPAASYSVQIHRTPDAGNFACSDGPPFCGVPNQDFVSTTGVSPNYLSGPPANFYEAKPVAVTISGSGSVVSEPAGIKCPGTCSVWLPPNYSSDPPKYTRLTASPADGWFIKDWSGACDGTTGATCEFFNSTNGASAGVVFGQTSTPKPASTPRITPRPAVTPRPVVTPRPSTQAASTATPAPATPATSAIPGASIDPGASTEPASTEPAGSHGPATDPSAVAVAPSGASTLGATQAPASDADAGQTAIGDVTLLIALGIVLLTVMLAIGYVVGRRRGTQRTT